MGSGKASDDDERWLIVYKQCLTLIFDKDTDKKVYQCWFIDRNTVRVSQGHRLVWIKFVKFGPGVKETETERYDQIEFDCSGRALYHIRAGEKVTENWSSIQPNWILDDVAPEACKLDASK